MGESENENPIGGHDDDPSPEAVRAASEAIDNEDISTLRICFNCANMIWPRELATFREIVGGGEVLFPICANHADSPGVPREVHPAQTCGNFRPRPRPALRVEPPEPVRPGTKHIPLTRGLWAVVDTADFARLNRYRWYASPSGGGKMYARRNTKTGIISMHRELLHAPPEMCVDHKNRNGLDNRRDNLRLCTPQQNTYNRGPQGGRSRFKGVYPEGDKWYATIKHKGVPYYLGIFDDEIEAAKARDRKAYELEKDFAYLNFPDDIHREGTGKPEADKE